MPAAPYASPPSSRAPFEDLAAALDRAPGAWELAKRRSCVHVPFKLPDLVFRCSRSNGLILLTNMLLADKLGIVFGVANKRSIAWAIAQAWHKAGAKLAFTYQGERLKENVEELAGTFGGDTLILPCDVTKDEDITAVFKTVSEKFGNLNLLLHS